MNSGSSDAAIRGLSTRATLVKVFAWLFVGTALFMIAALGYETFKPPVDIVVSAGPNAGQQQLPIWPIILGLSMIVNLISVVSLMIFSLIWIHKAHRNLVEQNVEMDYSPGWTVGSYFVPFVNLVVPLRAMRELHNRSHGEVVELAHSPVDDVAAWWTAYIIGLTVAFLLAFKTLFDALTNIVFLTPVWMEFVMSAFSSLLLVISAIMLVKLVSAITVAQAEGNHAWKAFE